MTTLAPASMHAVQVRTFGGPEVLDAVVLDIPEPDAGQVRVKVGAAGINFVDTVQRDGSYTLGALPPYVPGGEVAGVVDAVGPGVDAIQVGQRVTGLTSGFSGGYAQYAIVDAATLMSIPAGLDDAAATALPVQVYTAMALVRVCAPPAAGDTVVVHAAAGGIGTVLIQLAKRNGARVIAATSSQAKSDLARRLGADATVDYTRPDWVSQVLELTGGHGADVIYSSNAGQVARQSIRALATQGHLVLYGAKDTAETSLGPDDIDELFHRNRIISGLSIFSLLPADSQAITAEMQQLLAEGSLEIHVGHRFALSEVEAAHRLMTARESTGKLVLIPTQDPPEEAPR